MAKLSLKKNKKDNNEAHEVPPALVTPVVDPPPPPRIETLSELLESHLAKLPPSPPVVPAVERSTPEFVLTFDGKNADAIISHFGNKSKAIRQLHEQGVAYADIARAICVRYQHVRNVLDKPLKRQIKAEREARGKNNA
jgi:hypothetical protein